MQSLLLSSLALSASAAVIPRVQRRTSDSSTPFTLLASTYNASIVTLSFTPPSTLELVSVVNTTAAPWNVTAPTWIEPSVTHPNIAFVVDESTPGQVVAFDTQTLQPLSWASTQSTHEIGPLHAGTSADGKWLFTPNYGNGSHLVHPLSPETGLFAEPNQPLITFEGSSPTQEGPHPHMSVEHPTTGHAFVVDLGTDEIHELALADDGIWKLVQNVTISPAGSGPRHMRFNADGTVAYVLCETTSSLHVYSVEECGETGLSKWTQVSVTSIVPPGATPVEGSKLAAGEIVISKDGTAVYASNRNDADPEGDAIAAFAVVPPHSASVQPPKLVRSGGVAVRGMNLSPNEDYLVAGTQLSGTVAIYARDQSDCGLSQAAFLATEEHYAFNSFIWV